MLGIRTVDPSEAHLLGPIARKAKAHWGYSLPLMESWDPQLRVSADDVDSGAYFLAEHDGAIAGFCGLSVQGVNAELEHMWVLPSQMGQGVGKALFESVASLCRDRGIVRLKVVSDPHARGFYERLGARYVGEEPSVPEPRTLPVYIIELRISGQKGQAFR